MPRSLAVAALAVGAALAAGGCGAVRDPAFEDRTAKVTWGGRTLTFTLDACGLDGQTAFLVGRTDGGAVLQVVVGVEDDGETGVPASTGVTVLDFDVTNVSAFGDEAWARRGEAGAAPGEVTSARIRGARIQVAGRGVATDDDEQPVGDTDEALTLDARCDE